MQRRDNDKAPTKAGAKSNKTQATKPELDDNEKATRTKTQTTMPGTEIAVIDQTVMLEAGTPQAIALGKENVIESELRAIEINYKGLRINGLEDVQGIKLVSDARKYCKKVRTTTERVCKVGRNDAIAEQRRWLQTEKYVVDRVQKVEQELINEENRIETLRDEKRKEEARKLIAENERLNAIGIEFARYGKYHSQEELRGMPEAKIALMLADAIKARTAKDAADKKLLDDKLAAEEQAEAMKRRIAELEAQLSPPPAIPEAAPMPEQEPQRFAGQPIESVTGFDKIAADKPNLPPLPKLPTPPTPANGTAKNAVTATPEPLRADNEATLISKDKAALITFAKQVDILKSYLPVCGSKKAAGLNEVIAGQIIKFSLFITKKAEEL